jgi:teichuronic acid biosynthesis glycosyltransferase TuaC
VKVAVISEFYPRRGDPVLGVWAHRQAMATRDAGAEVRVLVLHRLVPPRASLSQGPGGPTRALQGLASEPRKQTLDGLDVTYVRYVSPPRSRSYHTWGAWAAPALALALRRVRHSFEFDLIHAHNAIPAGDAARRARLRAPLVVSVHGGDVLYTAPRSEAGREAVARNLAAATTVLANSRGIAALARRYGASDTRVVHLGADLPEPRGGGTGGSGSAGDSGSAGGGLVSTGGGDSGSSGSGSGGGGGSRGGGWRDHTPSLVTVGHLVARKRHADVMRAVAVLAKRHPTLRYSIVGDGPERVALEGLATRLGVSERVEFYGQLPHAEAIEVARRCTLFAMPSTEEAFGVAYVEAMAGGVPAIGCRGEPGPEEIAAAGDGFMLVPPGDIERLTQRIDELLSDPQRLREASIRARETVALNFSWRRCGEQTLAAYQHALQAPPPDPEEPSR